MSSRRNRQQPPDAPAGSSRRGGVKNTHKTGHRQHDVIQLRGAVDVLPPTVPLEHCTTFYIYWTAQENNIKHGYFQMMDYYYTATHKRVCCIHIFHKLNCPFGNINNTLVRSCSQIISQYCFFFSVFLGNLRSPEIH